jgi:dTDP-4-dehydrorhamnose 3,5-epimerase
VALIISPGRLAGVFMVDVRAQEDARGLFARTFCRDEFRAHGLNGVFVQSNTSFNRRRGTLRGMHYQAPPKAEAKLVRCTSGAIFDVVLDLRPSSATYLEWEAVELTSENRRAIYVPEGLAHGFQALTDAAEVLYDMTESYAPECARGVLWNDPAFGIRWPLSDPILSDRDRSFPPFPPATEGRPPVR